MTHLLQNHVTHGSILSKVAKVKPHLIRLSGLSSILATAGFEPATFRIPD
jgi:hypothetical protein